MKFVLSTFLIWRVLLFIPIIFGNLFLNPRSDYEFSATDHFLLYPWANFDGVHYLTIASVGYTTEANFFSLFPILIKVLNPIMGNFFAGFFIANISLLGGLIFLYKLILLDYSAKIARWTVVYLLIFPTSFYYGAIYTESLFLFLIVSSFYFARKGNWLVSSVLAMFSSAARLVGVLMLPSLLYQYVQKEGFKSALKLFSLFIIPLGIISYALFNFYKWGDALYFIKAHGNLANSRSVDSIILFPQTIYRYFNILTDLPVTQYEWWIALFEVSVFFIVSILLLIAWKLKIRREYLIFSILAFLLPALSGTFSSLPRYVIVLFPIFIAMALLRNNLIKLVYIVITPVLLFILLMFFSRGYFVA